MQNLAPFCQLGPAVNPRAPVLGRRGRVGPRDHHRDGYAIVPRALQVHGETCVKGLRQDC